MKRDGHGGRRGLRRILAASLIVLLMSGSFVAGGVTVSLARTAAAAEQPAEFDVFWEAWDLVVAHFVDRDKIDFKAMTYGAIEGMLASLGDEGHTTFLPPEAVEQHQTSLEGAFEGIGAYVSMEGDQVTIVAPIDGSPAEAAGILAGDIILAVDGESIAGLTLNQVIAKIRGPAFSPVVLTVLHPDAEEPVDIVIVRQRIELNSVSWSMIPGTNAAYLEITQFAADTGQELAQALLEIDARKSAGEPVEALVLDLRNNPGGYLREAIKVASQFLPKGEIILQEADAEGNVNVYRSRGWGYAREIPLVVLINQGTASAGEITAGAIKENARGLLIGETTFGTGTVLNQFNLSDGSAILLGVTNWLTPQGNLIKGQGITPDVAVELESSVRQVNARTLRGLTPAEVLASEDVQFLEALKQAVGDLQPVA
ncbi:MAG: S41 family peptidase, partial [Caldilineae bacterium]